MFYEVSTYHMGQARTDINELWKNLKYRLIDMVFYNSKIPSTK